MSSRGREGGRVGERGEVLYASIRAEGGKNITKRAGQRLDAARLV